MTANITTGLNSLNLTDLDTAMDRLKHRRMDRRIAAVNGDPRSLKLQYRAGNENEGCFIIKPDNGKHIPGEIGDHFRKHGEMALSKTAVKSILHHGNISMPENMMPSELARIGTKALANKMESMKGLNILTTSQGGYGVRQVEAFIPGKIDTLPDHALMLGILERLNNSYRGQIKGIRFQNAVDDVVNRYWVVFGNPVIDEKPSDIQLKTHMMLDITGSDKGLGTVTMNLGLMRIICANGLIVNDWDGGRASWSRNGTPNDFYDKIGSVVDAAGQFGIDMNRSLTESSQRSLGMHGLEAVKALIGTGILGKKQGSLAENLVGRDDPKTDYEFLQVCTESAQALEGNARKRAEALPLRIICREGGFSNVIRNGMSVRRKTVDSAVLNIEATEATEAD